MKQNNIYLETDKLSKISNDESEKSKNLSMAFNESDTINKAYEVSTDPNKNQIKKLKIMGSIKIKIIDSDQFNNITPGDQNLILNRIQLILEYKPNKLLSEQTEPERFLAKLNHIELDTAKFFNIHNESGDFKNIQIYWDLELSKNIFHSMRNIHESSTQEQSVVSNKVKGFLNEMKKISEDCKIKESKNDIVLDNQVSEYTAENHALNSLGNLFQIKTFI